MTLPVWTRLSFPAALLAAFFFLFALSMALLTVPDYLPSQHPVSLLGTLPGMAGALYRWAIFIVPGLLMGISSLCLPQAARLGRPGRIGLQLGVIAALGYMLMGMLGIGSSMELEAAMRGQALAWLLWLSAAVAACMLWAIELQRAGRGLPAVALLLAGLMLLLISLLPVPGLTGPLAQPLAWLLWMAVAAGLARVGANPAGLAVDGDI